MCPMYQPVLSCGPGPAYAAPCAPTMRGLPARHSCMGSLCCSWPLPLSADSCCAAPACYVAGVAGCGSKQDGTCMHDMHTVCGRQPRMPLTLYSSPGHGPCACWPVHLGPPSYVRGESQEQAPAPHTHGRRADLAISTFAFCLAFQCSQEAPPSKLALTNNAGAHAPKPSIQRI